MKKRNKYKVQKEPSLFRKIVEIHFEQIRRRRALHLLQKQSWSFDFLALLLVKASKIAGQGLDLTIINKDGMSIKLLYDNAKKAQSVEQLDDSIFNHLDDDAAINDFIIRHNVRR